MRCGAERVGSWTASICTVNHWLWGQTRHLASNILGEARTSCETATVRRRRRSRLRMFTEERTCPERYNLTHSIGYVSKLVSLCSIVQPIHFILNLNIVYGHRFLHL